MIAGADDDRTRSGAAPAAEAADVLDAARAARRAAGARGLRARGRRGRSGRRACCREVRAWDRPEAPGLVRARAAEPQTVVDGSAEGVAGAGRARRDLAGAGLRLRRRTSTPAQLRARAREVVITDSNRRRVLVASRMAQNAGAGARGGRGAVDRRGGPDPFPERGSDAQTVAVYDGHRGRARAVLARLPAVPRAPAVRGARRRPGDALAGRPRADADRHTLEVIFDAPARRRRTSTCCRTTTAGRRSSRSRSPAAAIPSTPGRNRLTLGLQSVRDADGADRAPPPSPSRPATAGIRELRIPGVKATEALRPPVLAERALAGQDLGRTGLTYVFQRTTGDDPFRRDPWHGPPRSALVRDRGDAEPGIERVISPPAARDVGLDGWVTTVARRPRLRTRRAGRRRRHASTPRRASRGGPASGRRAPSTARERPWIGSWQDGRRSWLEWETERRRDARSA